MSASSKDERILKWWNKGCSINRIAAKLGNPNNLQRVVDALVRANKISLEQADLIIKGDSDVRS